MDKLSFDGNISVIIPTRNGFVIMPYNSDLLTSFKQASDPKRGILVSTDVPGLVADIKAIYEPVDNPVGE